MSVSISNERRNRFQIDTTHNSDKKLSSSTEDDDLFHFPEQTQTLKKKLHLEKKKKESLFKLLPVELFQIIVDFLDPMSAVVFLFYTTRKFAHCREVLVSLRHLSVGNVSNHRLSLMIPLLKSLNEITFYFNSLLDDITFKQLSMCSQLKSIQVYGSRTMDDSCIEIIGKSLSDLEKLRFYHCTEITDCGLANISALDKLTTLDLYCCTDVTWESFPHFPLSLKELDISHCNLSELESTLPRLTNLTSLSLAHSGFLDEHLQELCNSLTNIKYLNLTACVNLSDEAFNNISFLENLEVLDMTYCNRIGDQTLFNISKLQNLTTLLIPYCDGITTAGLTYISKMESITELDISKTYFYETENINTSPLRDMVNLRSLSMSSIPFDIDILEKMYYLERLDISNNDELEDADLKELAKYGLPSLKFLNLSSCPHLTEEIQHTLKLLPTILSLYIFDCNIHFTQKELTELHKTNPYLTLSQ